MKRRDVLFGLLGIGLTVGAKPVSAHPQPVRLLLQDTRIAGSAYYGFRKVASELKEGQSLQLRRELDNTYDERAVAVFFANEKLGYLPRIDNAVVASLMDRQHRLHAEVREILRPDTYWEPMTIRVWVEMA